MSSYFFLDSLSGCAGLAQTYQCVCDYMSTPIVSDIVEDLTDYFPKNSITEFHLSDFMKSEKSYPNPDFVALMTALTHNLWFKELICDGHNISSDGFGIIAEVISKNQTLKQLSLKNTNAKSAGMSREKV